MIRRAFKHQDKRQGMSRSPNVHSSGKAASSSRRERAANREASTEAARPAQFDIDPAITAGFIHDRYDVVFRGRAVSPIPLQEITLTLDGALVGRVGCGSPNEEALSDESAHQYAFQLNLPLRRAHARRQCACVLTARTADGGESHQSFELSVDPASSMPVSVASGPTRSSSTYTSVRPPV